MEYKIRTDFGKTKLFVNEGGADICIATFLDKRDYLHWQNGAGAAMRGAGFSFSVFDLDTSQYIAGTLGQITESAA